MTAAEIVERMKTLGKESYRKVLRNHGTPEPFFGVSIEDMKKHFVKIVRKDYQLALELFDTGIHDAMYLAGLIADDAKMTRKDLQHWVETANAPMISEYAVPWVAAESNHGWELGLKWIDSKKANIASAGWATLSSLVAIRDDEELDLKALEKLLGRVKTTIHKQPDRVRYVMNGFVIAVGTYVAPLSEQALHIGEEIGPVEVDMQGTACKVPYSPDYILKVKKKGTVGKKRKTVKC